MQHRHKPWPPKMRLSPTVPRDAAFADGSRRFATWTWLLRPDEVVLYIDEMTNPAVPKVAEPGALKKFDRVRSNTNTAVAVH